MAEGWARGAGGAGEGVGMVEMMALDGDLVVHIGALVRGCGGGS